MKKYVLMLEEDTDDQSLTKEALQALQLQVSIRFKSTSDAFLNELKNRPLPELVLIDYNSVPDDGLTVLQKIKQEPAWAHIPIVILSDNKQPHYRDACYQSGASSFIQKPVDLDRTKKKIEIFFRYWIDVVEL